MVAMVKKFTVPCDFGGQKHPVTFYVGDSAKGTNPIGFQSKWLGSERGGVVSSELTDSLMKLKDIADKNRVPFEDLCSYVIDELNNSAPTKNIENKNNTNTKSNEKK
jgi:hypothetical protein